VSRHRVVVLLLAAILLLARSAPAAPLPAWTLLFYMDANNDLESNQMDDLEEMLGAASSPEVRIFVLAARSPASDESEGYVKGPVGNLGDWSGARLLTLENGKFVQVADWGTVNMASGATLERFLKEGLARHPARKVALIFGDHGSAWPGCCGDESPGNEDDMLTLAEIEQALGRTVQPAIGKLELIGFDACLMGNFESAVAVAPFARTLVSSEELEPGSGWCYTPTLARLVKNPQMDGAALGRIIVDEFMDGFEKSKDGATRNEGIGATLGVIDLARIPALAQAVNVLAEAASARLAADGRAAWVKLSAARAKSEEFGKSENKDSDGSSVFDLADFARALRAQMPENPLAAAAAEVEKQVRAAVLYSRHGRGHPAASGLSIFFPLKAHQLGAKTPETYESITFARGSAWLALLRRYAGVSAENKDAPQVAPLTSSATVLEKQSSATFSTSVRADDVDECWFVLGRVEDGRVVIIGQMATTLDEAGALKEEWDGGWFSIASGGNEQICPITDMEEVEGEPDTYLATVPVERKRGGAWEELTLFFYVTFKDDGVTGEFVYAFEDSKFGQRQVDLRKGDVIRPVYVEVDENGAESLVASDHPDDHLTVGADGLAVRYVDVDPGKYVVGFLVTDYAGNTTEETVEVEIK